MGCNVYHAVAITFCAVTLVMLLVTVGTPAMIQGCMSMSGFLNNAGNAMGGLSGLGIGSSELSNVGDMGSQLGSSLSNLGGLNGASMCLGQGLTRESVSGMGKETSYVINPTAMEAYMYIAAGLLCISVILCLSALIVLSMATCGDSSSYEAKNKSGNRTRTAMILLGVTALCAAIGMTAYSIGSKNELNHPENFVISFGKNMMGAFGGSSSGLNNIFESNRRKRDLMEDAMKGVMSIFKGLEIKYGYSFIIGWVSVVLSIVSLLLTACSRFKLIQQPYPGNSARF